MPQFAAKLQTDRLRVKTQFISQVLTETAQRVRADQNAVVEAWDLFESGAMKTMLQGHFSVNSTDSSGRLSMSYLNYYRFLDMPDPRRQLRRVKKEGYHTYNRIVFGILYHYGIPELQYGLTKEVYEQISGEIGEAMAAGNKYKQADAMVHGIADKDRFMAAILGKRMRMGYQ